MHPDVEHAILFDEFHDTADGTGVEVADKFASMIRGAPLHGRLALDIVGRLG